MAEQTLTIVLTADNKQALAAMKETVLSLDGVEKAGAKAGGGVKKLGTDFTGMSRVIQDLPYGFTAISNNLTQLIPAAGAAGLAFSALVAGLEFAQVGLTYWTRGQKGADEATQASTKSLTEFYTNLNNVRTAFESSRAGVMSKKEALDKYNDSLGQSIGFAKSMDEAESLMAKNTSTVIKALQLRAQAQTYANIAAQNSAGLETGQAYRPDLDAPTILGALKAYLMTGNAVNVIKDRMLDAANNADVLLKKSNELNKQALELDKTLAGSRDAGLAEEEKKKALDALSKAKEDARKKEQEQERQRLYALKLEKEELDGLAKIYQNVSNFAKTQNRAGNLNPVTNNEAQNYANNLKAFQLKEQENKEKQKDLYSLKLTMDGNSALNAILLQQNQIKDTQNANMALANNLTDYAVNGLSNLVNVMMNGGNIGNALGDMFKKLAADIAMAAAKAAIFQGILSLLPVGGGGGKFIQGFGKLLGFASGGTVSGPTTGYPVMLHGTEHIVRPDQMKSIIASAAQMGGGNSRVVVEGRIAGNDIWLSQKRTDVFRNLST